MTSSLFFLIHTELRCTVNHTSNLRMWSQQRKPYYMEPSNTASYSVHLQGWNRKTQRPATRYNYSVILLGTLHTLNHFSLFVGNALPCPKPHFPEGRAGTANAPKIFFEGYRTWVPPHAVTKCCLCMTLPGSIVTTFRHFVNGQKKLCSSDADWLRGTSRRHSSCWCLQATRWPKHVDNNTFRSVSVIVLSQI